MPELPKCNVCQRQLFGELGACVTLDLSIVPTIMADTGEPRDLDDPEITIKVKVYVCLDCFATKTGPALGLPDTVSEIVDRRQP